MIRVLAISAMMLCVRTALALYDEIPGIEYVYVDDYISETPVILVLEEKCVCTGSVQGDCKPEDCKDKTGVLCHDQTAGMNYTCVKQKVIIDVIPVPEW